MKTDARETLERMARAYNHPSNWRPEDGPDPSRPLQAALRKLVEMHGDNYPALARMVLAITELDLIETEDER